MNISHGNDQCNNVFRPSRKHFNPVEPTNLWSVGGEIAFNILIIFVNRAWILKLTDVVNLEMPQQVCVVGLINLLKSPDHQISFETSNQRSG
jgi:hypothetical protein